MVDRKGFANYLNVRKKRTGKAALLSKYANKMGLLLLRFDPEGRIRLQWIFADSDFTSASRMKSKSADSTRLEYDFPDENVVQKTANKLITLLLYILLV